MSGSSLSDSSYSVSSDAALAGAAPQTKPKLWEQIALSADKPDLLWTEGAVQQLQLQPAQQSREQEGGETAAETPVSGELLQSNSLCH